MSSLPTTGITAALQQKLAENKVSPTAGGGTAFLKFDARRSGEWLFGPGAEPVSSEVFALDLESMQHGYIQWHQKKVNRRMVPVDRDLPEPQDPIYYKDSRGKDQTDEATEGRSFEGTFADGERFVFETNSFGGRKATDSVFGEVFARALAHSSYLWPHVRLDSNSYDHPEYGQIFEPVLTVVEWYDEAGNPEGEGQKRVAQDAPAGDEDDGEEEPAAAEAAPPKRRRRVRS